MGLSIHYGGSISDPGCLAELISEVQDIAGVYGWPCHVYEREFPENHFGCSVITNEVYGISFAPPECEPVFICFLSNGKMSGPVQLQLYGDTPIAEEKKYLYIISVKTQFAGPEVHMVIVQLFRYLSQKYFARFNMTDEGNYWETSDEDILKDYFKKYTDLLNSFSAALETQPYRTSESIEAYIMRLAQLIHEKKKRNSSGGPKK
jgi:hypothetical protein